MKRIFIIIAMAMVAFATAIAQNPGIALSSNGKMQFFTSDKFADALRAAQPNDTIWLSAGTYSYAWIDSGEGYGTATRRKIVKPLVIIGSGAEKGSLNATYLVHDCDLELGAPAGTDIVIEGIILEKDLYPATDCNVTLRNCALQFLRKNDAKKFRNLLIDRCRFVNGDGYSGGLNVSVAKMVTINNSYMEYLEGANDDVDIFNCFIEISDDTFQGLIRNSFVYNLYMNSGVNLRNIYYKSGHGNESNLVDCKILDDVNFDTFLEYNNDPAKAVAAGYVGTDGTAAGSYGGETPFTLNPSYPTADLLKTTITNDKTTRKLKVKVSTLGK